VAAAIPNGSSNSRPRAATPKIPSNRDWLKAKGFKTLDDVAKSYREAEKAIHARAAS
jgi:hypothetical protein